MDIRMVEVNTFEIKSVEVTSEVRNFESTTVNGVEDVDGTLMPCTDFEEGLWCPQINLNTGQIYDWEIGTTAKVHYKTVDCNSYCFYTEEGDSFYSEDQYVVTFLDPKNEGYGDYIIMDIDENGFIKDFNKSNHSKTIEILLNPEGFDLDEN